MATPQWIIDLTLNPANFVQGMNAAQRSVMEFEQTMQILRYSGVNAIMSLYQATPMLQGVFDRLTNTMRSAAMAYGEFEQANATLEFLGKNVGATADEIQMALRTLTKDGLMSVAGATEALKNAFTMGLGIDTSIAAIEAFKSSAIAAGKSANEVFAIFQSIRTMQSQRLDEYGITKNIQQVLREEIAVVSQLQASKTDLSKVDANYRDILEYMNGEKITENSLSDENLRLRLMTIGIMKEAINTYTAYSRLSRDTAEYEKEGSKQASIRQMILAEGFRRLIEAQRVAAEEGITNLSGQKFVDAVTNAESGVGKKIADIFVNPEGMAEIEKRVAQLKLKLSDVSTIGQGRDAQGNILGEFQQFAPFISELTAKLDANKTALLEQALASYQATGDAKAFVKVLDEIGISSDRLTGALLPSLGDAMKQNFQTVVNQLNAQLDQFNRLLGKAFAEAAQPFIEQILRLVHALNQMDEAFFKNLATVLSLSAGIVGVFAAMTGGVVGVNALANSMQFLGNMFTRVNAGAVALMANLPGLNQILTASQERLRDQLNIDFERQRGAILRASTRENFSALVAEYQNRNNGARPAGQDLIDLRQQARERAAAQSEEHIALLRQNRDFRLGQLQAPVNSVSGMFGLMNEGIDRGSLALRNFGSQLAAGATALGNFGRVLGPVVGGLGMLAPVLLKAAALISGLVIAFGAMVAVLALVTASVMAVKSALEFVNNEANKGTETYDRIKAALEQMDAALEQIRIAFSTFFDALMGSNSGLEDFGALLLEIGAKALQWFADVLTNVIGKVVGFIEAIKTFLGSETGQRMISFFQKVAEVLGTVISLLVQFTTGLVSLVSGAAGAAIAFLFGGAKGLDDFKKSFDEAARAEEDYLKRVEANRKKAADDKAKAEAEGGADRTHLGDKRGAAKDADNKEALTKELDLLKAKRDLAIASARSDQDVINARSSYLKALEAIHAKLRKLAESDAERLKLDKELVEARNDLYRAEAQALSNAASRTEATLTHRLNVKKIFYEAETALEKLRANLIGDRIRLEQAAIQQELNNVRLEEQAAANKLRIAEMRAAAAAKAAQATGADRAARQREAMEAQNAVVEARKELDLIRTKLLDAVNEAESKATTADARNEQARADYNLGRVESVRGVRGELKHEDAFRENTALKLREYAREVAANPAANDYATQKQQFEGFANIYRNNTAELIKRLDARNFGVQDTFNATSAAAADTAKQIADMSAPDGALNRARDAEQRLKADLTAAQNAERAAQGTAGHARALENLQRVSGLYSNALKDKIATEAQYAALQERNTELSKRKAESELALIAVQREGLKLQMQYNEAEAKRALESGNFTGAAASLKAAQQLSAQDVEKAQAALGLTRQTGDNAAIARAQMDVSASIIANDQVRAQQAVIQDKTSFFGLGVFGDKRAQGDALRQTQADIAAAEQALATASSEEEKNAIQSRINALKESESSQTKELFKEPLRLQAEIEADYNKLSTDLGNAVGGAFNEAIQSGDWTQLGSSIAQATDKAFKSFIGSTIQNVIGNPVETAFKRAGDYLKGAAAKVQEHLVNGAKGLGISSEQMAMGIEASMAALSAGAMLWASMSSSGGTGEQAIKDGSEISDQTTEVRGVVMGETSVGIGKLKELFDPIAISMQDAAIKLGQVADLLQAIASGSANAAGPAVTPGAPTGATNVITLNLNTTGTITVIADIPGMQKELNQVIQATVEDMVKREITAKMSGK